MLLSVSLLRQISRMRTNVFKLVRVSRVSNLLALVFICRIVPTIKKLPKKKKNWTSCQPMIKRSRVYFLCCLRIWVSHWRLALHNIFITPKRKQYSYGWKFTGNSKINIADCSHSHFVGIKRGNLNFFWSVFPSTAPYAWCLPYKSNKPHVSAATCNALRKYHPLPHSYAGTFVYSQ